MKYSFFQKSEYKSKIFIFLKVGGVASGLYAGNARPRRGRRVNVAPKYARRGSWGYIRLTQLACSISVRC